MGARTQALRPSSTSLPGHWQGAGSGVQQPGFEPVPVWDTEPTDGSFTHHVTVLALLHIS